MNKKANNTNHDIINNEDITVACCSIHLGVTESTIRNWINSGDLKSIKPNYVTKQSLHHFQNNVMGRDRLTHRANKSKKDSHDHVAVQSHFSRRLNTEGNQLDSIGEDYQEELSNAYQNKEGIYYTPEDVVNHLLSQPTVDISDATFCDPCCGSGNFILRALELGFKPENVYGYDIDAIAVEITKARVKQFTGSATSNIKVADFLKKSTIGEKRNAKKFDYIYTNPPWGKKAAKKEREALAEQLDSGKSNDTCSLFFFSCLKSLNTNGELGLLLPESFFNVLSFETARAKASQYKITKLIDYGKVFVGLMTKAQAIILENKPSRSKDKILCQSYHNGSVENHTRLASSFCTNPKSILNLHCKHNDAKTLQYVFNLPHITLKSNASWGLGIVTGNNKRFIKSKMQPGYIPVYKGLNLVGKELTPPKNFIPSNLSIYQQVASQELYTAEEKILYKFISSKLIFYYDTKQRYTLNSLNIFIPHAEFPVNMKVLSQLLNSDFMNWIFLNIFSTSKILRGDLENLPIHSQFLQGVSSFDETDYLKCLNIEKQEDGSYQIVGE